MTSKRLGILLAALFALWSLVGSGWFVPSSSGVDNGFGTALAFAGDPDTYTSTSTNTMTEGDPDSYTGQPGMERIDDTNPPPPPPADKNVKEDKKDDAVRTIYEMALLAFLSVRGVVF